jgi:CubicO group peptidase (beta-lactamase class C family)
MMKKLPYLLLLFLIHFTSWAQSIPRSTPEAEGVSSAAIQKFIESYKKEKHELHSIMIIRHGKVISEAWWSPYAPELKHSMYSVSKSWTSTAVGFAVSENKLKVTDKVLSFFPEYADLASNNFLKDLTVKDLLTMSVGHKTEPLRSVIVMQPDWMRGFLKTPIEYVPGTKFLYNTLATYMLSGIIQKVTGQSLINYLEPRLFKPLGISGVDREYDSKGINTGGWGIRVKTEDMAKLGLTYLNGGKYNGKQVISNAWVKEATQKHIDQNPEASQAKKDSSDWLQGYGYQFWRCRNGAFRADGAYGQYIVMMPEQDAVVVITSESMDLQDDLNMIWQHLLPAFGKSNLPTNKQANQSLKQFLNNRKLESSTPNSVKGNDRILGKTYVLDKNPLEFASFKISKSDKGVWVEIGTKDEKIHQIPLGLNGWKLSENTLIGPYSLRSVPAHLETFAPFKVAGEYIWKDENTIEMTIRYIESPHHWKITYQVQGDKLKLTAINSYAPKTKIDIAGN